MRISNPKYLVKMKAGAYAQLENSSKKDLNTLCRAKVVNPKAKFNVAILRPIKVNKWIKHD